MSKETAKLSLMNDEERAIYMAKKMSKKPTRDDFANNFFSMMKGNDGYTPIKGKDYFTEIDKKEFKQEVTPIKGKDYFTDPEIIEFAKAVTPIKGKDYFDGKDGRSIVGPKGGTGKDGKDGKDGINGSDGKNGEDAGVEDVIKELKKKQYLEPKDIKGLPINMNDMRWHGGGLSKVSTDNTLTGDGTPSNPLSSIPTGSVITYIILNVSGIYKAYKGIDGSLISSSNSLDTVFSAVLTDASTNPCIIEFGAGTFTTVNGISIARGNIKLKGQGQGITTLQLSASASDATQIIGIQASNTATGYALTVNANAGDLTLTISASDSTHISAGDYILLRSNLDIDTEIPGRKQGDLYIVQSVNTGTGVITLGVSGNGMDVHESFTTANSSAIDKLTMLENISVSDISFTDLATSRSSSLGSGQTSYRYIYNLNITNCSFRSMFYSGIQVFQTWHTRISNCEFRDIKDLTPSNNTYYGVEVRGASSDTVVTGCTFHNMRHGVTQGAGGTTVLAGRTRNLVINGNSSSATTTAHFDCHQGALSVVISNNTCSSDDSAANAIQTRSPATIVGNSIQGIKGKGVSLFGTSNGSIVSGNYLNGCTDGITVDVGVSDIIIANNTITGTGSGYPISFVGNASNHGGNDSMITGNYIYGNIITTYGILIDSASNVLISGNKIKTGTACRILTSHVTGTNVVVQNNFLSGLGGTPFQNFSASATHMLLENFGYNLKGNSGNIIATPFPTGAGNVTNYASTNAVPDSGVLYTNVHSPKNYTITGGTVSLVEINGISATAVGGVFKLGIGDTIKITYSVAPTVVVRIA